MTHCLPPHKNHTNTHSNTERRKIMQKNIIACKNYGKIPKISEKRKEKIKPKIIYQNPKSNLSILNPRETK